MSRIAIPARDDAKDQSRPILDAIAKQFGFAPNLHRLMALSPSALAGWSGLQTALAKTLDIRTLDQRCGFFLLGRNARWPKGNHDLLQRHPR